MNSSDPLLDKAQRYIRSAQILANDGDIDSAASRLYYAMFYIAEALLLARGLSFSSHHAVIAAYGQYFSKTNELDPRYHQSLLAAFSQRQLGDYTIHSGLSRENIDEMLKDTAEFLDAAQAWLAQQQADTP